MGTHSAPNGQRASKARSTRAIIPVLFLVVLLAVLLISSRSRPPVIQSIAPDIARTGDVVVIRGSNFGAARNGAHVTLGGVVPTTAAYLSWGDDRISLRLPPEVSTGFMVVHGEHGASNGVLFANRDFLPVVVASPTRPGQPFVAEVSPRSGAVGDRVVITGKNFGLARGASQVLFSFVAGIAADGEAPAGPTVISASDRDFDYESWSDTQIAVRVPDGGATGNLAVATDKGSSNEVFFEVTGKVGTKRIHSPLTYSVAYDVAVSNISARGDNSLYLWVPQVWPAPEQRDIRLLAEEPEPLFADVGGVKVYHLRNLVTGGVYSVSQHYIFDRYAVETVVNPRRVVAYDTTSSLYERFTAADELVQSDAPAVLGLAAGLVRDEPNPWTRARAMYDWMRARVQLAGERRGDVEATLAERSGDSLDVVATFVALLRAANVPARPVAGYLVQDRGSVAAHYWAEFFLQGFGWVPVDLVLGSGAVAVPLDPEAGAANFFFGNLDNRHLAFSKGLVRTEQLTANGRTVQRPATANLQLHHEEASGELQAYTSRWGELEVVGVY